MQDLVQSSAMSSLADIPAELSTMQAMLHSFSQQDLPSVGSNPQPPPQSIEAADGGDQAQQEQQGASSQWDPDHGGAGTFLVDGFVFGFAPHGFLGERDQCGY